MSVSKISKSNLSKSMQVCSLFDGLKLNDFNEFLIVLSDYYYDWLCIFPFFQKEYDMINSNKYFFPGKLHVKYESELRNDISGNFIIKGIVQLKTLYIKLPKENIYVDSSKFQEELFESKFNELLNIFACLNARYVDFYFQNMDSYIENLSTSASLSKVEAGESILSNHKTQSKRRIRAEFSDKYHKPFDPEKFKERRVFYYLPKEYGWRNVIKKYVVNVAITIFEGNDPDTIKSSIVNILSNYFLNIRRRDKIPRSDLIAAIEGVQGIDSVSLYFVSQSNEDAKRQNPNSPDIGFDEFGDILIGKDEIVIISGGWEDRNGIYYDLGAGMENLSSVNIDVRSIVPYTYNSRVNNLLKGSLKSGN